MENTVWEALWSAYVNQKISGASPLMFDECEETNRKLDEFCQKHNISVKESAELEEIIRGYTYQAEHCGFIGGLKVGLMVQQGLGVISV